MKDKYNVYKDVDAKLKKTLTEKRYGHVNGVVETSIMLAKKYGEDYEKCRIAAIFHDYSKQFSKEENDDAIAKYGIEVDELERSSKELLHSKIAAKIAEIEYNISDTDILNAISYHTTGRARMSLLEKIIFVADSIEAGRIYPNVENLRKIAIVDIDKAVLGILNSTISHLLSSGLKIHPNSVIARNYFLDNNKEVNR
ncbi:MAG: bis(5'-nucleosyl)-tetraphosphatase (symmetrical) YqeK [Proteocatella sp.]